MAVIVVYSAKNCKDDVWLMTLYSFFEDACFFMPYVTGVFRLIFNQLFLIKHCKIFENARNVLFIILPLVLKELISKLLLGLLRADHCVNVL
jgi:hypothetical protein